MWLLAQVRSEATAGELRALLRGDSLDLIFGILLLALGVVTLVLFASRREAKDLALLAFGGFSALYGLRLLAGRPTIGLVLGLSEENLRTVGAYLTYVIPVPAFAFWERMLGRGWNSTLRLGLWATVVFGAVAVIVETWWGARSALMAANNVLVIIGMLLAMGNLFFQAPAGVPGLGALRIGGLVLTAFALGENVAGLGLPVWPRDYEVIGFFFFTCCLGYAAALRVAKNEKNLLALENELETARRIQSSILPQESPNLPGLTVGVRYRPMKAVGGDFYDFLRPDRKSLGVLVADVSGHGIPAALIASMVKVALAGQIQHASNPGRVLSGMNQVFAGQRLGEQFLTAGYLHVDIERRMARYAGAGHPPLLFWNGTEQRLEPADSNGPPLGLFAEAEYSHKELALAYGDRLILYTDGVAEAGNTSGEFFGDGRFQSMIAEKAALPAEAFVDALLFAVAEWTQDRKTSGPEDDITLLVLDIVPSPTSKPTGLV